MKIATWNLESARSLFNRREILTSAMKGVNADVWVLIRPNHQKFAKIPQAKSWEVPIFGRRRVSDHFGAFVDIDSSWLDVEA